MPYFRHGDPLEDFEKLDREQAKQLDELPKCDICGEPIQDEYYYEIGGDLVCRECLDNHFRKETAPYD